MADFKLDDANLQALISKSILDTLTPAKKEEVLAAAVKSLMELHGPAGKKTSLLQDAFNNAMISVANNIAREHLENDETIKVQMREMITAAWATLSMGEAYEKMVERIGASMANTLTNQRNRW
jgi:hypothetical protein